MNTDAEIGSFGGKILRLSHESAAVGTPMKLNVFLPPEPQGAPVLFYLAGLTCTGDNGLEKGGFQRTAAAENIAVVYPDTSPRTTQAIKGEHDDWDFGSGAGFYVNATEAPWATNYHMETYITEELPALLAKQLPELDWGRVSVMGHSMGGHGALTLFLRHPGKYKSVSAFSPISNPTQAPWGHKAFTNYLGSVDAGKPHDATEIVKSLGAKAPHTSVLIDVGTADNFYKQGQLLPENLVKAAEGTPFDVNLRLHDGYDHSYFFISTFGEDHVRHHAKALKQ